jgi:hypothetical protein
MTLPNFPDVSPDPVIDYDYTGNLNLSLIPTASDGLDAYSISRLYDPSPTNAWVVANRIEPANSSLGYVTGEIFEMPASELPTAGNAFNYYIYAYRFAAGGGDAQYYYSNTFSITRGSVPDTGYGLQVFDSAGALKVDVTSALVAVAGIDSITLAPSASVQINITGLDNSGLWKVFLDGQFYSGTNPIYTSVVYPTITYSNGYYTLTNTDSTYSWAGTAFTYRVS